MMGTPKKDTLVLYASIDGFVYFDPMPCAIVPTLVQLLALGTSSVCQQHSITRLGFQKGRFFPNPKHAC